MPNVSATRQFPSLICLDPRPFSVCFAVQTSWLVTVEVGVGNVAVVARQSSGLASYEPERQRHERSRSLMADKTPKATTQVNSVSRRFLFSVASSSASFPRDLLITQKGAIVGCSGSGLFGGGDESFSVFP